jgi:hypothetical protein
VGDALECATSATAASFPLDSVVLELHTLGIAIALSAPVAPAVERRVTKPPATTRTPTPG